MASVTIEHALSIVSPRFDLRAGNEELTLSMLERNVLDFLCQGHSSHEIAATLALASSRLDECCASIVEKLGARNLIHAVALTIARDVSPSLQTTLPPLVSDALDRQREGIVVVDSSARLLWSNRAANEIAGGGGLRLCDGILRTERPDETAALHRIIADCEFRGSQGSTGAERYARASRHHDRPALSLLITFLAANLAMTLSTMAAVAIYIVDPEGVYLPAPEQLQHQFGLTPAEIAVALQIIQADGVAAVAERLGVTLGTVKTHLVRIFAKTGTSRQADLVRLLLNMRHGIAL